MLRAGARVRMQEPFLIYLECRSKSKKCDKQLTHIVRVIASVLFFNKSQKFFIAFVHISPDFIANTIQKEHVFIICIIKLIS